ncbi:cupin domain-containing protein, partial [Verrucomicrobiota bacterium]
GNHYHLRKTERYYVISGRLELLLEDVASLQQGKIVLSAGSCITVQPHVAHAFISISPAQVLEFSPVPYDPADTKACDLVVKFKKKAARK